MLRPLLLIALLCAASAVPAQMATNYGSISVKAKSIKAAGAAKSGMVRKRFYLFEGGLKENKTLVDRIKAAEITSRDCYYAGLNASPCFISWLQAENCESPFCRKVEKADVQGIKEFETSYNKGLTLYNRRPDIALDWIVNNMPLQLVSGFYAKQKSLIDQILTGLKPIQSTMTTSTGVEANFIDIPVGDKPAKYLISNVIPTEVGNKSYVWACEVDITSKKPNTQINLTATGPKTCAVTVRDLKVCNTGACDKK